MKTQIITIFAALVLTLGVTNLTYAAAKNADDTYTVLTDISAISKIEVRGNVELYISDGAADQVKVYNKYYSESALVQSSNGVLRISSYKADKLIVWVTANDLRGVSAFDNAEVKSFGDTSKIEFDVDLHDHASAQLNLDANNTHLNVFDDARANLSGTIDECTFKCDHEQNIDHKNLVVRRALTVPATPAKAFNLADL
jgi:hypothetical protein